MSAVQQLLTDHIDIWTAAENEKRSGRGRASDNASSVYGINKLRELILELAVRGKLVPQNSSDEPASKLMVRIRTERANLIKNGSIKIPKNKPKTFENEIPFDVPSGWEWARLDDISPISLVDGDWIETKDQDPRGEVRLVQLADIGVGEFKDKSDRFINKETFKRLNCTQLLAGDILIARLPSPIGRACLFPESQQTAITVVDVAVLRPFGFFNSEYIVNAINSKTFHEQVNFYGKGATRFRIATGNLKSLLVPVPPMNEQNRIVAKVGELMALCDQLEAHHNDAADAHQKLVSHLLGSLTQSQSAADFNTNWQRIAAHFDTLFTTEESIDALKQTVLQLAVMGKLVAQDDNDEPAKEWLQRRGISSEGNPIPGWSSVPLGKLGMILGGATPSKAKSEYWNGSIPWVSPKDMKRLYIGEAEDNISEIAMNATSLKLIPPGSILFVVRGMILAHSFPVALTTKTVTINQDMKALVIPEEIKDYLLLYLRAMKNYFVSIVDRSSHGTCKLLSEKLWPATVAIPPLPEQLRIIAKVSEITALCDHLRSRIADAKRQQQKLADVLVEHAAKECNGV